MNELGFWIFMSIALLAHSINEGYFDKLIPSKQMERIKALEENRKQDDEIIQDLQDRLKKAGLDNGIG